MALVTQLVTSTADASVVAHATSDQEEAALARVIGLEIQNQSLLDAATHIDARAARLGCVSKSENQRRTISGKVTLARAKDLRHAVSLR